MGDVYHTHSIQNSEKVEEDRLYNHWFAFRAALTKATKNQLILQMGFTPKEIFDFSEVEANEYIKEDRVEAFLNSRSLEETKKDLDWVDRNGQLQDIRTVYYFDKDYPRRLRDIPDPPFGLYVKGELPDDDLPAIAMVGARDASPYGLEAAEHFAKELADCGVQIISGMARGIDAQSHLAALKSQIGTTYAVLGSGIDVVYPKSNRYLYDRMAERGGVISEFLPGTQPLSLNFPLRNRIISGLSDGVFIIEARKKSGTMITADQAGEQGRDVFCLPGRYYDGLSFGCMDLIGHGAKLVYTAKQIFDEIHGGEQLCLSLARMGGSSAKAISSGNPNSPEAKILKVMSKEPRTAEWLIKQTGLGATDVLTALTMLEMERIVYTRDGIHYMRRT